MVTTEGLLEAYFDCRRNKRKTASAVRYEMDYEHNLVALRKRINARTYKPGVSICFVVSRPRYREVFAASFEDRIVHHYIALRLEPLFEEVFSPRTFNCRKGKGQLYGVEMLQHDIRECSDNYTSDCWVSTADLQGFFMSIDKQRLEDGVVAFTEERYDGEDKEDLIYLIRTVVRHDPEKCCIRQSPDEMWEHIPWNKSLFTNGKGKGVAIGNLFAQHFANFLLNNLDWLLPTLVMFSGRYVDDFYMVDKDKQRILKAVSVIREFLAGFGLRLHPHKFYIQHYTKGIRFTGMIVKPHRTYILNRTVCNFRFAVQDLNGCKTKRQLARGVSRVNSYLGLMRHTASYNIRREVLGAISPKMFKHVYICGHYEVVKIRRKDTLRYEMYKRIADGRY